jgi:hypothetical protein
VNPRASTQATAVSSPPGGVFRLFVLELRHHRDVVAEVFVVVDGGEVPAARREQVAEVGVFGLGRGSRRSRREGQVVEAQRRHGLRVGLLLDDRLDDHLGEQIGFELLQVRRFLHLGIARALELRLGAVHLARGDEEESRRRSGCVVECGGRGETAEEIRARAFETSRHPTRV